jgi:hypothetical protein
MFQIAHAMCQGWKNDIPTIFKCESFTPMQANQPTKYVDNIFRNITFLNFTSQTKRINTPWEYVDLNFDLESPIEFYGYFQSGKNFCGFEEKISNLFQPTEEFIDKIYKKFPNLKKEKTVSIHIRRGDYLTINTILPTIDKTYIDECLNQIGNYDQIFIFSDDIDWAKENLNYDKSIIVENLEDYEDLWLISLCKINIMSNSSFSWWGAFLNKNKNKNKKVFAPSIWFGPSGEKNYSDIYEDYWNVIDTKYSDGKIKFFH